MASQKRPRSRPSRPARALAAAARYRNEYPGVDDATVEQALRLRDPALQYTPRLVGDASRLHIDTATRLRRQVSRLASIACGDEHPPRGVEGVWRLAVLVRHLEIAMTEGEGKGMSYGTLLVSRSRCALWWGESPSSAGARLNEMVEGSWLTVVGLAGRTRRVRLNRGSTKHPDTDAWMDPDHLWRTCTDPSIAYAEDRTAAIQRWYDVVVEGADGPAVIHDPGAADRQAAAADRHRAQAAKQRAFIESAQLRSAVAGVMKGLPRSGSSAEKLDSWMRLATARAQANPLLEEAADEVVRVARSKGHSDAVAQALATRLIHVGQTRPTF